MHAPRRGDLYRDGLYTKLYLDQDVWLHYDRDGGISAIIQSSSEPRGSWKFEKNLSGVEYLGRMGRSHAAVVKLFKYRVVR